MIARAQYSAELRKAIGAILVNQKQVTLVAIEQDLPAIFESPSRVTIAKAVVALGWVKLQRPGSGAIYAHPSSIGGGA